jgi:hypothetical protein
MPLAPLQEVFDKKRGLIPSAEVTLVAATWATYIKQALSSVVGGALLVLLFLSLFFGFCARIGWEAGGRTADAIIGPE